MKKILFVLACMFAAAPMSSFASGSCNYTSMEASLVLDYNMPLLDAHAYRLAMESFKVNEQLLAVILPLGSTVYNVDTKKLEKFLIDNLTVSKASADYFVMTIEMVRTEAAQYGIAINDPACIE